MNTTQEAVIEAEQDKEAQATPGGAARLINQIKRST